MRAMVSEEEEEENEKSERNKSRCIHWNDMNEWNKT